MIMFKSNAMAYEVPLVSAHYLQMFIEFMVGRGVSRQALLEGTNLPDSLHDSHLHLLSMKELLMVLDAAQRFLTDERAGFEFGQQLDLQGHGLLGFALLKQKNHRELASMVVQYLRVALPIMDMKVSCSGEELRIELHDIWELGELRSFIARIYMGSIYALTSLICRQLHVEFDFPSELDDSGWSQLAPGASLTFAGRCNQVVIPLSGRPARDDDLALAFYLANARSRQDVHHDEHETVVARVREQVIRHPGRDGTLERVGERLGMSPRSIRHHLKLAGVSFHDIRSQVRQTFATRYLKDTSIPLHKIAEILGYSDQASFTKAFRGWTGETPGDMRRSVSRPSLR
ncbi:helix-turn-helix domain-containing protein [Alcanivorax hongdengensis A-11-3]|uniref:Helix-turn-helix domain-containing protein n=2 Tax=Alcanivorax hongdengensis TaxID=519051 RepID=L0WE48_9GAMM|nr:helix-turn-helix domain-containing protein [Alcanivorax hongdengensis A-11-3]